MNLSIAEKLAEFAVELSFRNLPNNVVYAAKQRLLDTLGCAIGGYDGKASKIVRRLIGDMAEKGKATIIGSGAETTSPNATLANGVMVRILDFNDVYLGRDATHPNEPVIPPALAVGEEKHVNGKELITAIVLGYEVDMRFAEVAFHGIDKRGWSQTATLGQYVTPIVAGKLMGFDVNQMANAIGISGCHNVSLGGVWYGKVTMMKQILNAFSAQSGVVAAQLAEKGFTGPKRIIEGEKGFCEAVAGECDLTKLTGDLGKEYKIVHSWIKMYSCCLRSHTAIDATLALVKEHNLKVEGVKNVRVKTYKIAFEEVTGPSKYKPSSISEAQFSMPYCLASAIKYMNVGPNQFTQDKINDQDILDLASKIEIETDQELESLYPDKLPAVVEIETKQGMKLIRQMDYQKGHSHNPVTGEEIQNKFTNLTSKSMKEKQIMDIVNLIDNLEKVEDVNELTKILLIK